jgi:hypothetical protein
MAAGTVNRGKFQLGYRILNAEGSEMPLVLIMGWVRYGCSRCRRRVAAGRAVVGVRAGAVESPRSMRRWNEAKKILS